MPSPEYSVEDVFELVHERSEFMSVLYSDSYEKRTLVEELEVSRSTVDRTLRDLETAQMVADKNGQYHTTFYGKIIYSIYQVFLDILDDIQQAQPLLALLSPDVPIDVSMFINSDVYLAEEPTLHVPSSRIFDLVQAASEIKAVAYANTSSKASEVLREEIRKGTTMEVVLREELFRAVQESDGEAFAELSQSDRYTAYIGEDIPFGMFLFRIEEEWIASLLIYGPKRNLQGVIFNDSPSAVDWAFQFFQHHRDNASPVQGGQFEAENRSES